MLSSILFSNSHLLLLWLSKFCFGIVMGYNLYFYLDSRGYNYSFLKNSSFLELLIIFNMFYFIISMFIYAKDNIKPLGYKYSLFLILLINITKILNIFRLDDCKG